MPPETGPRFSDHFSAFRRAEDAFNKRQDREQAILNKQRLNDLLELSILNTGNKAQGIPQQPAFLEQNGLTISNPIAESTQLSPKQEADLFLLGDEAGISQDDISEQQNRAQLNTLIPQLPIPQQVDAFGGKAITGPSSIARLNDEKTAKQRRLSQALFNTIDNGNISPENLINIIQGKKIGETKLIKATRLGDDTERFYMATKQPDGSYRNAVLRDEAGELLSVPAIKTTLDKDTAKIQKILGMSEIDALKFKLFLKAKSPEEAWAALVEKLSTANFGRFGRDPEKLRAKAEETWKVSRPGVPVPVDGDNIISDAVKRVPVADDTSGSTQEEARNRAGADGYSNLGNWIDGKGWEVLDDSGQLIGHYN